MTVFLVKDEFFKRLTPIEGDAISHALCTAMLLAVGHESADQLLDGRVTPLMLKRRLPSWSMQRRRHVAGLLVALGIWQALPLGVYQFVDWDLEQPSAEQTVAQREKWKARKRAQRAVRGGVFYAESSPFSPEESGEFPTPPEIQIANDFAEGRPNVHPPVPGGVHPPSDPLKASPPAPAPQIKNAHSASEPAASAAPPAQKAKLAGPRKARAPRPTDPLKQAVVEGYEAAFQAKHDAPATPPNWATVQLIVNWAKRMQDPEAAIRQSLAGYFVSWTGDQTNHPMAHWAKNPAGYYAQGKGHKPPGSAASAAEKAHFRAHSEALARMLGVAS